MKPPTVVLYVNLTPPTSSTPSLCPNACTCPCNPRASRRHCSHCSETPFYRNYIPHVYRAARMSKLNAITGENGNARTRPADAERNPQYCSVRRRGPPLSLGTCAGFGPIKELTERKPSSVQTYCHETHLAPVRRTQCRNQFIQAYNVNGKSPDAPEAPRTVTAKGLPANARTPPCGNWP